MIFSQMKLLEEEDMEKREEEERKERKRTKERDKKLRRKERLKGKEKNKERKCSESIDVRGCPEASEEKLSAPVDTKQDNAIGCRNSIVATDKANLSQGDYPNIQDEDFSSEYNTLTTLDCSYDDYDGDITNAHDGNGTSKVEQSKFYRQRLRCRKEFQLDVSPKWSDRHHNAVISENGMVVGRSESRNNGDNFGTSSRRTNGLNRQSKINVPKSNSRNVGHKCNEKFFSSNCQMSDRYNFQSYSCSPNNRMTRGSREMKPVSMPESAVDTCKNFYRGSKNNQVDLMHESNGRPKGKVISGNYPNRDLLQSKKVWEPMESRNSDSDVTLGSTGQVFHIDMVRSSIDEVGDSGEVDGEDRDPKRSGIAESCQNDLSAEVEGSCSSIEIASEELGISASDPSQGSTSSSGNCSSRLSEGDNNTTSSNHENTESSSTSDSEVCSQKSEVRDSCSTCIDNGLDVVGSDALGNPVVKTAQNFGNGFSSTNVCSQPQSMLSLTPNQNIQFPVFQIPSDYYHQNPVSWPIAPTNGSMPFLHPNHYLYGGSLGYRALQQPTPLFNSASIPVYQPVARAKGLNAEELTQTPKPASVQEHFNGANAERVIPDTTNSKKAALNRENGHGNSANLQDSNGGGFSLFHFGGPVALSTGCKTATASTDQVGKDHGSNGDDVGYFNSQSLSEQVEKDHGSNKETAVMEEYNLFAATNTLRFFIF